MDTINSIGIGVISIFLIFILKKSGRTNSDYLLSVLLILIAIMLYTSKLIEKELSASSFVIQSLSSFYIFPVFMAYAYSLLDAYREFKKNVLLYLLSSVAFTFFLFFDFVYLTDYSIAVLQKLYEEPTLTYHFFYKSHHLIIISSLIVFLRRLLLYNKEIRNEYSFIEPIRFEWLKNFVWVYLTLNIISILAFLSYNYGFLSHVEIAYNLLSASLVIAVFYLCYHGVIQYIKPDLEVHKKGSKNTKYSSSTLKQDEMKVLYSSVQHLFNEEKLYCKAQLKIQDLAKLLNTTTHCISQTINSQSKSSFYDFVNSFRIEHLKKLIIEDTDKQYTLLAHALDSGFNSKASLNRIFKKHTGITPKEFQAQE